MTNKKVQALDAIQSLIITAKKWTELEFPDPLPGVEEQTIKELSQLLDKSNVALANLLLYEKRYSDVFVVKTSDGTLSEVHTIG